MQWKIIASPFPFTPFQKLIISPLPLTHRPTMLKLNPDPSILVNRANERFYSFIWLYYFFKGKLFSKICRNISSPEYVVMPNLLYEATRSTHFYQKEGTLNLHLAVCRAGDYRDHICAERIKEMVQLSYEEGSQNLRLLSFKQNGE